MWPFRLLAIGLGILLALPMAPSESTNNLPASLGASAEPSNPSIEDLHGGSERAKQVGPVLIEANPDAGFEYPYYLYAPEPKRDAPTPILVEPNNSPRPTDDFATHLDEVKTKIERGLGRHISDELAVPLVFPVFPRPVSDPVDWTHSVQQLDLETMQIEEGPLKRIDQQLLHMVADARHRLEQSGYNLDDGIMLNGFSASGTFANRFAALHPDKVISVTAGGISGMPILPHTAVEGNPIGKTDTYPLNYHVGVANLEAVTGAPFDRSAFRTVHQFLYIGENDQNDALLYPDPYTGKDLRIAALLAYGQDIHEERFPRARAAYKEIGAHAVFRMYEDTGHTPTPAMEDVVEFHRRTLAGDSIDAIRADLGGNVPPPSSDIGLRP